VLTDTQAQLGYIHHACGLGTPSRKELHRKDNRLPSSALKSLFLTFFGKQGDRRNVWRTENFAVKKHHQFTGTSWTQMWQKAQWQMMLWDVSLSFHRLFSVLSLCIQV